MSHDLIIPDNSYRSCLILIYTARGCCVHAGCHETAKGLAIISSLQNYVCVRGQYRDLGFYTLRIFENGKRRRVGICDDSSEPSLLPFTKYGCLAERIQVVYSTCSSLRQPSRGGMGVAVEVILEGFISEIESFLIIYFYFHLTQKLKLSQ